MSAHDEVVAVLLSARWPDGDTSGFPTKRVAELLADALLASPALARVIQEREFEAIKAANLRAIKHEIETPSRGHGGCCGDRAEGPT